MESGLDLAQVGLGLVHGHKLRELRERYGFSRSAQAHMIGVSPTALRSWENGRALSSVSAKRVASWYTEVQEHGTSVEDDLLDQIELGQLVHVTVASQQLAMSYSTILQKCQGGMLRCVDLGPLGLYISKAELLETT